MSFQSVTRCGAGEQQRRDESKRRPFQPANVTNTCKIITNNFSHWNISEFNNTSIKGEWVKIAIFTRLDDDSTNYRVAPKMVEDKVSSTAGVVRKRKNRE